MVAGRRVPGESHEERLTFDREEPRLGDCSDGRRPWHLVEQRDLAEALPASECVHDHVVSQHLDRSVCDRVVAVTRLSLADDRLPGGDGDVQRVLRDALQRRYGQGTEDAERAKKRDRDCRNGFRRVHGEKWPEAKENERRHDRAGEEEGTPNVGKRDHDGDGDRAKTPRRHRQAFLEREDTGEQLRRSDALEERLPRHLEQAA